MAVGMDGCPRRRRRLPCLARAASLRRAFRPPAIAFIPDARPPQSAVRNLYEGFLTNILNPAIASFYLVLLPQFIPEGAPVVRSVMILTGVHIGLAATWHVLWAAAGGTLARVLAGGRPRQVLEAIAGTALLALAIKIAIG